MFINWSDNNIFWCRDHDTGRWGVLPHGGIDVRGGAISVGLIAGKPLLIEVSYPNEL